jgi:ribulose-phosphate 3-epimerase
MEFRRVRSDVEIGIDGGIKEGNIARIAQCGADVIFVGSAIYLQPEPGESFRHLRVLAEQGSWNRV